MLFEIALSGDIKTQTSKQISRRTDRGQQRERAKELLSKFYGLSRKKLEVAIELGKVLRDLRESSRGKDRLWKTDLKEIGLPESTARQYRTFAEYEVELLAANAQRDEPMTITEARTFVDNFKRAKQSEEASTKARNGFNLKAKIRTPRTPRPDNRELFKTSRSVWDVRELPELEPYSSLAKDDGYNGVNSGLRESRRAYSGTYSRFCGGIAEGFFQRFISAGPGESPAVLDICAGRPVRGIASSVRGYRYVGMDVSRDQIAYNKRCCSGLKLDPAPYYYVGDARNAAQVLQDNGCPITRFDGALTCPPYWNAEVYPSGSDADLSHIDSYPDFQSALVECAHQQVKLMKPGAFMGIVMGYVRDKKTNELLDLPGDLIRAFKDAGALFWEMIVLKKPDGTAAIRAENMARVQKLVRVHEYLIVMRVSETTVGNSGRRGKN